MVLKLWSWFDTSKDWDAVLVSKIPSNSSIYTQALGFRRLSHLRIIDGVCWLGLSLLTFYNRQVIPPPGPYPPSMGRWILLGLILLEATKLLNDRYTRGEVSKAIRKELYDKR
jgi:hypothetical protein